ncbi:MAG: hypothetical protein ABS939_17190 [Psychrobacillus sp.]
MANKNDERILALKEQIAKKKEEIGKITRFTPITNCSLELDGVRTNLNVADREKLSLLAIKLHGYIASTKALELGDLKVSGYKLSDWLTDVMAKLDILSKKDKERELAQAEAKLSKLLSDEKQVELEIDDIAKLLG